MINAIISILILTMLVYGLNKKLPIKVCAVCAGVTLTWLWMLAGMWLGLLSVARYEFITAVLMGASIGGIVTELKKMFAKMKSKNKNEKAESLEEKLNDCC